ncbi:MAG: hydroxypyruvate isomerase [Acidobacteria bacterium]|nr:MAG: hydroxypyruvate isomerase [Acidobacteriota bacterium]
MQRRSLLQFPVLASLAQAAPPAIGFKLSVRVEALFRDMNLPQMMEKVAEAGYQGFEFGNWRAQDAAAITKLKNKLGLECACLVGNRAVNPKGMTLVDPADRAAFLAEIQASTEAAQRFETTRLVTLTGNELSGVPREAQHKSIVEGLKRAHDVVSPHGVTLIVEPLNTLVNHQGYYLNHTAEAFEIMREVSSPNVKILFDIYHVQIMDGNLIDTIRKNIASIGHFHVGDVPGRHEPGTGEINYANVFHAIRETGFRDFVAMEYVPSKDPLATLAAVRAMAAG